jgi:hypothetical protein
MQVHFEDRLVPAYTLVVTKPNLKNSNSSIRTRCTNTTQGAGVTTPAGFLPLDRMCATVVQVYKTIDDYRADRYPSFRYVPGRAIFPVIVTLGEGYWLGRVAAQTVGATRPP